MGVTVFSLLASEIRKPVSMFPSKDASVPQLVAVPLGTHRNFAWEACVCHTERASGCVISMLFDTSSSGVASLLSV